MTGDLPDGWRWAELGEICEIVNGSTPKSGVDEYWEGDICWVTPADLGQLNGPYIGQSGRTITSSGYDSCSTTLVPPGSVVMSSRAPIGHLGIAATSLCTNQGCKSFVPTAEVEGKYLYHALQNSMDDIRALGSGATFPEVGKKTLATFAIPLPKFDEQRRIANTMSIVERAKSAATAQLSAIDELAVAMLREIFPRSPAARLPRGWRSAKLGDVCIEDRTSITSDAADYAGMPYIGLEHIESGTGKMLIDKAGAEAAVSVSNNFRFGTDHVLYGKLRPYLNKVALPEFSGRCTTEIIPLRPTLADRRWLAWLLRSESTVEYAMRGKTGSRMPRTSMRDFMMMPVLLPPIDEQRRVGSAFSAVEEAREAAVAQLAAVDQLSDTFLKRLFASPAR